MRRFLAYALVFTAALAASVAPATAARSRYMHAYTCPNDSVLRVIFDEAQHVAIVTRIRQPDITLQQVASNSGFAYRRGDTYELQGNDDSIHWREGADTMTCAHGG